MEAADDGARHHRGGLGQGGRAAAEQAGLAEGGVGVPAEDLPVGPQRFFQQGAAGEVPGLPGPAQDRVPAVPGAGSEGLPTVAEIRASGVPLPELNLQLISYSEDAAQRFVFINGFRYGQGQRVQNGPLIVSISADSIVLRQQGRDFVLTPQ